MISEIGIGDISIYDYVSNQKFLVSDISNCIIDIKRLINYITIFNFWYLWIISDISKYFYLSEYLGLSEIKSEISAIP